MLAAAVEYNEGSTQTTSGIVSSARCCGAIWERGAPFVNSYYKLRPREAAMNPASSPRAHQPDKPVARRAHAGGPWEKQLEGSQDCAEFDSSVMLPPTHGRITPQYESPSPVTHLVHDSEFFSLAGDHDDSRQFFARSASSARAIRQLENTSGRPDTIKLGEAAGQHQGDDEALETLQTSTAADCSPESTNPTPGLSDVPSSCPLSQQPCGDEMIRLLLAQRSSSSHEPVEAGVRATTYCIHKGAHSSAALTGSRQHHCSKQCASTTLIQQHASTPKRLNCSGKRQRTADPEGLNLQGMPLPEAPPGFPQPLDVRASAAVVEIIGESPAWQEIFYYATTDPPAIRVRY